MLKLRSHIFNMSPRQTVYGKLQSTIERRIRAKGAAWAFTPSDFADVGDPRSVGMVFSRLLKRGVIRRVRRGIYEVPHHHPIVGEIGATADAVADALARRDGLKRAPDGAAAANELGLSTQVSAAKSFGIGPRGRTTKINKGTSIRFRKGSGKALATAGRASGHLAAALRSMGKGNVSKADLKSLRARMNRRDRKQLIEDLRLVPAWMRPLFKEVAGNES